MKGWRYEGYRHSLAAKGIRTFKKGKYHFTLPGSEVIKLSKEIESELKPLSRRIDIAGSIRRKVDEPVDVDIVMIPKNKEKVREKLAHLGRITAQGETMVETKINGVDVDTYFAEPDSYGAQLMTRTGPWQGNLGNRTLAKNKCMKLSQYGLFDRKTGKRIAGRTEKEIYEALGKKYKEPELRGM
jgi:DNA polymerase (family 10)